jgi:L-aspartate oxidase
VACSGVHGANRLASNSLLDGMVFGARVVEAVLSGKRVPDATGTLRPVLDPGASNGLSVGALWLPNRPQPPRPAPDTDPAKGRESLQRAMTQGAGVVRSAASLAAAAAEIGRLADQGVAPGELANLIIVAEAVVAAATAREESRGGHLRSDFPARSEAFLHRFVQ